MINTLASLEARFPSIKWREPLTISTLEDPEEKHYACRVCISNTGLKGHQVSALPTDPEEVKRHIAEEHE